MTEKQAEAEIRYRLAKFLLFRSGCRKRTSSPRRNPRRHGRRFVKSINLSHIAWRWTNHG